MATGCVAIARQMEILGDGTQVKPFFLVEDCIQGMLCAFEKQEKSCVVYNLGCESDTVVNRLADIVVEEMGLKDVKFTYTGERRGWPGDAPEVHFKIDKMKELGWQPGHSSDEAVRIAARRLIKTGLSLEG